MICYLESENKDVIDKIDKIKETQQNKIMGFDKTGHGQVKHYKRASEKYGKNKDKVSSQELQKTSEKDTAEGITPSKTIPIPSIPISDKPYPFHIAPASENSSPSKQ